MIRAHASTGYDTGDTVRLSFVVTATTGTTAYADADITVVVSPPAGAATTWVSTSTGSTGLEHDAVGRWHLDVVPASSQVGQWVWTLTSTGNVVQAAAGYFSVRSGPAAVTYSGDPSATPLDEARYRIGDTDVARARFLDSEVAYELAAAGGSVDGAVARLLTREAARVAAAPQRHKVGDLETDYGSGRVRELLGLAASAASTGGGGSGRPVVAGYAGGISAGRKTEIAESTGLLRPFAAREQGAGDVLDIASTGA